MFAAQHQTVPTLIHIEDDPLWADVIAKLVTSWETVAHLGFATSAAAGLELCREKQPAIVLLDLRLPDMDGFVLVDRLNALPRPPKILVLSSRTDAATLYHVWSGKVAGMIWKVNRCAEHLKAGIEAVMHGQKYFPTEVLEAIREFRRDPHAFHKILSDRQIVLLDAFGRGESDAEIAAKLGIGVDAVRCRRQQVVTKLNLDNTPGLMRWAIENGFGAPLWAAPPIPAGE